MRAIWQTETHLITNIKTATFITALTVLLVLPALSDPTIVHATGGINNTRGDAWGTLEVSGTDPNNLGGGGVNIYSNGPQVSYTPNKPNNTVNGVVSGEEWQCVELINRLYLTKSWITATWTGNGGQLYDNAPSSLSSYKELNGSITYLNPGDTLVLQDSGAGHAALINTYNSGTGAIQIESQNTNQVYDTTFSLSNKTISSTGWGTYSVKGVIHHPGTGASSSAFRSAFQANTGNLYIYDPSTGATNTQQGMMSGTSPSITTLSNGSYEVAFQANNGYLYTFDSTNGAVNRGYGMMSGTSPAITALSGGGYEIAFQANTGNLWVYGSAGTGDTHQGMLTTTNPTIAALGSSYEAAFQANSGYLYTFDPTNGSVYRGYGLKAGTSPSITELSSSAYQIAFQANTGYLWTFGSDGTGQIPLLMMSGTSPSIATIPGGYEIAFQASNADLSTFNSSTGGADLAQGMASSTSPTIAALSGGGWEIDFQANNNNFYVYNSTNGATGFPLGMMPGTSPAIAGQ